MLLCFCQLLRARLPIRSLLPVRWLNRRRHHPRCLSWGHPDDPGDMSLLAVAGVLRRLVPRRLERSQPALRCCNPVRTMASLSFHSRPLHLRSRSGDLQLHHHHRKLLEAHPSYAAVALPGGHMRQLRWPGTIRHRHSLQERRTRSTNLCQICRIIAIEPSWLQTFIVRRHLWSPFVRSQ